MSGHSKWASIKRAKGANDSKRAAIFTKLAHGITIAAKQGGGDADSNFSLRLAMDRAKAANMPKNNIERAIKRGTGELSGTELFEITYEGFGPAGVALVIEVLTDNKNRSSTEIRHTLSKHGGNLSGPGSTMWMFERKGVIAITNEDIGNRNHDELELSLIDLGADDIQREDEGMMIFTKPEQLTKTKEAVEQIGISVSDASLQLIPKTASDVSGADREKNEALIATLEELDDVSAVHTSL